MLQGVLNELLGPRSGQSEGGGSDSGKGASASEALASRGGPGSAVPTRRDVTPALSHEVSDGLVYTPDEELARLASHHMA